MIFHNYPGSWWLFLSQLVPCYDVAFADSKAMLEPIDAANVAMYPISGTIASLALSPFLPFRFPTMIVLVLKTNNYFLLFSLGDYLL